MRRLLVAILVLCGALAAVNGAAHAQTAFFFADSFTPRCGPQNTATRVTMQGGTNLPSVAVTLRSPSGVVIHSQTVQQSNSRWFYQVGFTPTEVGDYEVRATAGQQTISGFFRVPCGPPTLSYDPPCFVVGSTTTVTMTGRNFEPFDAGQMDYDLGGSEAQTQIRIPIDGRGTYAASFKVAPADRDHPGRAASGNLIANAVWSKCPPVTTTTTSTTTTTTTRPGETTTTTRPTTAGSTTTTILSTTTTTIVIPPPTPGASLVVDPPLGPGGLVARARGTGFPANQPVNIGWSPGIGLFVATAGPDGTFETQALVMSGDTLGPRTLVATSGAVAASAQFLVVPSTMQPAGQDVLQINRTRRFLQR
jgi:hypothetical protein